MKTQAINLNSTRRERLDQLGQRTRALHSDPRFIYHDWMVEYHLDIVYRIALESCEHYPGADVDVVEALVWIHDFGKPYSIENEKEMTRLHGRALLEELSFEREFINSVFEYWEIFERKSEIDLREAPIEVQIVSSADGASHFTGIFFPGYFYDMHTKPLPEIQEIIHAKIKKDWERKMVLPEIRSAFQKRYEYALEITGNFPKSFLPPMR